MIFNGYGYSCDSFDTLSRSIKLNNKTLQTETEHTYDCGVVSYTEKNRI